MSTENSKSPFTGKVVIITGAGSGQGACTAARFADEGAIVVVTDVAKEAAENMADRLRRSGGRAESYLLDVASPGHWKAVVGSVRQTFGRLDALVSNAGISARKTCADISLDEWRRVMDVNVAGVMLGLQGCAPLMRDSGGGAVVNVSSVTGLLGHHEPSYTASKWAVRGLTKTQALEYVDWGIRVNSIHPGLVEDTSFAASAKPAFIEITKKFIPMGRLGKLEEMADLVLFLCSPRSSFITGAEIAIDGGYTAGAITRLRKSMSASF
ncbi:SDR family NAD(P)-dependent oxidoreductase [Bordetella sp. BOR01]|uniref:SDR family NAD(P)-dependent oxidoreductase n=1 Tax=Bordetella sp. BOR01 TaxID=2854779 RepID=UPI001C454CCF|nr:glucose 1-dehydrogenase [Bordetella sp. BOR01]MBV7482973.1 glucose 1-dehydrogenase [Bordetella sp. BOR01]